MTMSGAENEDDDEAACLRITRGVAGAKAVVAKAKNKAVSARRSVFIVLLCDEFVVM